jgi:DNA helicase-2/ATP-dependent DNA helicase PcrA
MYVEYPQTAGRSLSGGSKPGYTPPALREEKNNYVTPKSEHKLKKIEKHVSASPPSAFSGVQGSFSEGDKVSHERFGKGVIIEITGELPNTTALVEFEGHGRKKLLLRFAKLSKL